MPRKSAALVTTDNQDAGAVQMSGKGYERLSDADKGLILRLAAEQRTQTEIAKLIGCSQSSVSDFLQRVSNPAAVVQKVLKAHELKAADAWARAVEKAANRGDHRPARELIEAANPELRPQPANSNAGGGVTIVIGMPGQPVELPTIDVSPVRQIAPGFRLAVTEANPDGEGHAK